MEYALYQQCGRSVEQALDVLETLRQRRAITTATVQEIHLRRATAIIALQASFEELRHAFITPLDREELFRLRQAMEALPRAAEDIALTLYTSGRQALPTGDTRLLSAVTACCRLMGEALARLDAYPRSDTAAKRLSALERQLDEAEQAYWQSLPTADPLLDQAYRALRAVVAACTAAASALRHALLKLA